MMFTKEVPVPNEGHVWILWLVRAYGTMQVGLILREEEFHAAHFWFSCAVGGGIDNNWKSQVIKTMHINY